ATNLLAPGDPTKSDNSVTFTLSEDSNTLSCPTTIIFGGGYSPAYTFNEDNLYIPSIAKKVPVLVTYSSDNKNLIVNRLPDGATQVDVPMSATCNVPAKYTLSTNNIPNLSSYQCVCLIDSKTGAVLNNFSDNSIYTFIATEKGQEFDYIVRFTRLEPGQSCSGNLLTKGNNMQLNSADGSVLQANSPDGNYTIIPTQNGAAINFNFPQAEDVIVSAYNMLGQKVINDIHTSVSESRLDVALPQTAGIYTVRVVTSAGATVKKIYR
ncbi:MAG: T9SS type A sorting domain-containing protein, partial [Bacteroidia bacterium]|nr:T9SS type A sorting domain-containing protein [Bacteroidia bacterium]